MLREISGNLAAILPNCRRRDTLDLYLANGAEHHLSRGRVERVINGQNTAYQNWIESVSELKYSLSSSVDRVETNCQNINSVLGFDIASNLRLLDYAHARIGKVYQSTINPNLIEDVPIEFIGTIAGASATEKTATFEVVVDYDALGSTIASYTLSPRCWWGYKNGIECTSQSDLPTCPKTRAACRVRGKEWEFGGWEFFEQPVSSAPGSGGNDGGGGTGGGDNGDRGGSCFTGDTRIWTPRRGEVPFARFADEFRKFKFNEIYSFNEQTGAVEVDTVEEVFEHRATKFFEFTFDDGTRVSVTPEHPFWNSFYQFIAADKFRLGDAPTVVQRFARGEWKKSRLTEMKWNSNRPVKVYNVRVRKNRTYFANRLAVHNTKWEIQLS